MKTLETKLTRIGNSRGLRLPAEMIRRYHLENGVLLQEQENQIVLKGKRAPKKLSWEETARQTAAEDENWQEWDNTAAVGLETCPWDHPLPPEAVAWLEKSAGRNVARKSRTKQ
jgi:antitoxin component of MazEF toxin-antitoxin module